MGCQASRPVVEHDQPPPVIVANQIRNQPSQQERNNAGRVKPCCGSYCVWNHRRYCCLHGAIGPSVTICACCQERLLPATPPRSVTTSMSSLSDNMAAVSTESPSSSSTPTMTTTNTRETKKKRKTFQKKNAKKKSPSSKPNTKGGGVPKFDLDTTSTRVQNVSDHDLRTCLQTCLSVMECPICLDSFSSRVCTLPCGHSICRSHTKEIFNASPAVCPVCRDTITPSTKGGVYRPTQSVTVRDSMAALEQAVTMMLSMNETACQRSMEAPAPTTVATVPEVTRLMTISSRATTTTMSKEEEAKEEETVAICNSTRRRSSDANGGAAAAATGLVVNDMNLEEIRSRVLLPPTDYEEVDC